MSVGKTKMTLTSRHLSIVINTLIGLFFILTLSVRGGYNIAPVGLMVLAVGYLIYIRFVKKQALEINTEQKWLIFSYLFYFSAFLLSYFLHDGRTRELDNPSRVLLLIPVMFLLIQYPPTLRLFMWIMPVGALVAGLVALFDRFVLGEPLAYLIRIFHIQGGDIAMTFAMFSLVITLYCFIQKQYRWMLFCLISTLFGMLGSFLSTARGGWIGIPLILATILFLYRKRLSKSFFVAISALFTTAILVVTLIPSTNVMSRVQTAYEEVKAYVNTENTQHINTSVGLRFEMWKSAVIMIKENPLLGWGTDGALKQRQEHAKQGIISAAAADFGHAHNQYLDELSKRGVIGLAGLLLVFIVPLVFFIKQLKISNLELRTLSTLGVVHIISTACYCLTQGFFSHNSGSISYFFLLTLLFAATMQLRKSITKN